MSQVRQQNYKNHKRFDPLYHYVLSSVAPIVLVASLVYSFKEGFTLDSWLWIGTGASVMMLVVLVRQYATKLQDRIIRQEENLRHIQLTGKSLDARLTVKQIVALRFAKDEAFPALCTKAAESGMKADQIKQSISQWRADDLRV